MFLGDFPHKMDSKGRVILPAKFRDLLDGGIVIARGMDGCLDVWTREAFQQWVAETRVMPRGSRNARMHRRMLTSGAHEQSLDLQGRIVIPPTLRSFAGLEQELMIVGADDHVEIWDRARWEALLEEEEQAFANQDGPIDYRDAAGQ